MATLERLLAAAEQLFSEQGYEETSVAQIVELAHASVGVFYNRFADKRAIFRAVQERFAKRTEAMWLAAVDPDSWAGAGLAEAAAGAVAAMAGWMRSNSRLIHAFGRYAITDDVMRDQGVRVSGMLVRNLQKLMLPRRAEIGHPLPELAIDVGFRMVWATLQQATLYNREGPATNNLGLDTLARELARAYVAYLHAPDADTPPNS
jgi:AcrR family transcriptional regulator